MTLMLLNPFWSFTPPPWRVAASLLCFVLANAFSWTSARALGENLRFDAAIGTRHELVRHGPYAIVRHPIYTSFLCVAWGIGLMATPPVLFAVATIVFLAGTEIRVRIEDRLLEEHFGDQARQFRRSTSAYIPFLR
ncbi:MAG: isoprenylcysteine carboxylmethyltransferase family protein [Acidobacteria bacterium]|nr:isoprenylcysteine carboxylmethyltransferase family protein [Acidobacteriota bacterium]